MAQQIQIPLLKKRKRRKKVANEIVDHIRDIKVTHVITLLLVHHQCVQPSDC